MIFFDKPQPIPPFLFQNVTFYRKYVQLIYISAARKKYSTLDPGTYLLAPSDSPQLDALVSSSSELGRLEEFKTGRHSEGSASGFNLSWLYGILRPNNSYLRFLS